MPIKVKPSETEDQFIGRCMSEESSSFPDESQRYAVCIGYWDNRNMSSQERMLSKLNKKQEMIEPNPCTSGYIAIGLKPKNGKMVPNCVPIED